ncbi:hypothetical protein KSC_104940 [Ktedonobacter sp. SOSP1-52]|nr:hypothetical protein KSC_104940 [Ktedonobacter sp. SOSP1-52]
MLHVTTKTLIASRQLPQFLQATPQWCQMMKTRLDNIKTKQELLSFWKETVEPAVFKAWWSAGAGALQLGMMTTFEDKLVQLMGPDDARTLLSHLGGASGLASLGLVVGIAKVRKGTMSQEDYLQHYGHRGPHEYELSHPNPVEDESWLEKQLNEASKADVDVEALLQAQQIRYEEALKRFQQRFPQKATWLKKRLAKASAGAQLREAARFVFLLEKQAN